MYCFAYNLYRITRPDSIRNAENIESVLGITNKGFVVLKYTEIFLPL